MGPFRSSPLLILESSIFHSGEIFELFGYSCPESEGILFVRGFYEGTRRVEGEGIFNSREYKRNVMLSGLD